MSLWVSEILSRLSVSRIFALFDEDYYRYLFETYDFDCNDCSQWFGVPPYVWNYFELFDIRQGKKPLEAAVKFVESYPDLMKKYDIRDGYELHDLLKKDIGKDEKSAYHGIVFSKMPNIRFGTPDRDRAMYEIMAENAPISLNDLCSVIHV